jgi:hypothetical protein
MVLGIGGCTLHGIGPGHRSHSAAPRVSAATTNGAAVEARRWVPDYITPRKRWGVAPLLGELLANLGRLWPVLVFHATMRQ